MKQTIEKFIMDELREMASAPVVLPFEILHDEIYRIALHKKFRKYAVGEDMKQKMYDTIKDKVSKGEPLDIICLQGCFKLWRLPESPEADWAELFALMRLVSWIKPIMEIYKPGAIVEFFVDDLIMIKICNYTHDEILAYQSSFQKIIDFVLKHAPKNLQIKITPTSTRYGGEKKFWEKLDVAVSKFAKPEEIVLSPDTIATIEMNYRPLTDDDTKDPLWKEKNAQVHDAYMQMDDRRLYRNRPNAFLVFMFHHKGATVLQLGSTKDSVVKPWVGVGSLRQRDDTFMPTVLSQTQLANAKFETHDVKIKGLDGKNFSQIRLLLSAT